MSHPGEREARGFPDEAAAAVAPDEILLPQRPAFGQRDVDAGAVLCEPRHSNPAVNRHRQLADPAGQDALEVVPPQRKPVGVAGGEVADVQRDSGERRDLRHLPLRKEPIGDAALIEHLDGARMQTARAPGAPIILTVEAVAMHAAGHAFFQAGSGVWLTDHVPPGDLWGWPG